MRLEPLSIEVITYAPTEFFHCTHCEVVFQQVGVGQKIHAEQRAAAFPDDLKQDYARLAAWVESIATRHPDRVRFKIIDAASIEGVFKSLRYRVRRFPAIVVDGKDRVEAGDYERATALVEQRLAASPVDGLGERAPAARSAEPDAREGR